jgi:transitional endoplasmic reticulum ATPase
MNATSVNLVLKNIDKSMKGGEGFPQDVLEHLDADSQSKVLDAFWTSQNTGIMWNGKHITLPDDPTKMDPRHALKAIERHIRASEEQVQVSDFFEGYYPLEAATAFVKAMEVLHGWADAVAKETFFGKVKPRIISVRIGPNPGDIIQVPMGDFNVPNVENPISTGIRSDGVFYVTGSVKMAEKATITAIIEKAREIIRDHSIYRGKALRFEVDSYGNLPKNFEPEFIDLAKVDASELIHSEDTQNSININVWAPIFHTAEFRKHKIPLKRSVLFSGPFGTGKTMTALVTAKHCVDNGWTFIMLDKPQGLSEAIKFAERYQPALIFAEDIERVTRSRDEEGNKLLNTIDGLKKGQDVFIILTTNNQEEITEAMRRPGRIDAVIPINAPDGEAAVKLVRMYSRGLVKSHTNIDALRQHVEGWTSAVLRELVERAKAAMIWNSRQDLDERSLISTAISMRAHKEWADGTGKPKQTNEEIAASMFGQLLGMGPRLTELEERITEVSTDTCDIGDIGRTTSHTSQQVQELLNHVKAQTKR